MRYVVAMVLLLAGCGFLEEAADVAQEPAVQEALVDTVEHVPGVISNPGSVPAWIGIAGGLVGLATAIYVKMKKPEGKK